MSGHNVIQWAIGKHTKTTNGNSRTGQPQGYLRFLKTQNLLAISLRRPIIVHTGRLQKAMYCIFCGAACQPDASACSSCGRQFPPTASQVQQVTPPPVVGPSQPPTHISAAPSGSMRQLSTAQLVFLWYGVFILCGIAIAAESVIGGVISVIAVTGLLVFSCYSHPGVKKRKAVLWIISPPLLLVIGIGGLIYNDSHPNMFRESIPVNQVQLFDLQMNLDSSCGDISGRVRNLSSKDLKWVQLRVQLSDASGIIDGGTADVSTEVPSAETRSFTATVCGLRPKPNWTWTYSVVSAKGQ